MSSVVNLAEVMDWIAAAGFAVREEPTATEVYDSPGGETRFYLRAASNGFVVTEAQRSDDEMFEFSSPEEDLILKFLVLALHSVVRERNDLPMLKVPASLEQLPTGFTVVPLTREIDALIHEGHEIAQLAGGSGLYPAVRFAQVANAPIDVVKTSLLDPDGAPLLSS